MKRVNYYYILYTHTNTLHLPTYLIYKISVWNVNESTTFLEFDIQYKYINIISNPDEFLTMVFADAFYLFVNGTI